MVYTRSGKELAWVTLLDFNGDTCYDTFVRPSADIVDYNAIYTGITPEMLDGETMTLRDV